jgi:hypothetical protein
MFGTGGCIAARLERPVDVQGAIVHRDDAAHGDCQQWEHRRKPEEVKPNGTTEWSNVRQYDVLLHVACMVSSSEARRRPRGSAASHLSFVWD